MLFIFAIKVNTAQIFELKGALIATVLCVTNTSNHINTRVSLRREGPPGYWATG
jgi:hypothetical protein